MHVTLLKKEYEELVGSGYLHRASYSLYCVHWLTYYKGVCLLYELGTIDKIELVKIKIVD